jgi:hypothetical protein
MLDCAAQSYAAARRSNPHPALAAGQAQALICAANLSDNTHSVVLAREALRAGRLQAVQPAWPDLVFAEGHQAARFRSSRMAGCEGATPVTGSTRPAP